MPSARLLARLWCGLGGQVDREMTEAAIRRQEVLEVRAARARQGNHVDRPVDFDLERLRVVVPVALDQEPIRRCLRALSDEGLLVRFPDVAVRFDLANEPAEPAGEIHGAEITQTRLTSRSVEDAVDAHVERPPSPRPRVHGALRGCGCPPASPLSATPSRPRW